MTKLRKITIKELEEAPDAVRRDWLPHEVLALAAYYGKKSPRAISAYLGRSVLAIERKANNTGLSYKMTDEKREEIIRKLQEEEEGASI